MIALEARPNKAAHGRNAGFQRGAAHSRIDPIERPPTPSSFQDRYTAGRAIEAPYSLYTASHRSLHIKRQPVATFGRRSVDRCPSARYSASTGLAQAAAATSRLARGLHMAPPDLFRRALRTQRSNAQRSPLQFCTGRGPLPYLHCRSRLISLLDHMQPTYRPHPPCMSQPPPV
ncbi:uncharacterized protein PAN0_001c0872 [Moesziomyces antarcticus]|uniref:uncharacterized protein n=1 Tax=Pseudozyma antarctica TaxID=84753 RepID=UPI0007197BEF|nr:uncharacterized protein PAN0_001c0872 [Moesziomyces antarcticus]GAK62671.1 hypothetical protein PAN0_001c0872 [Moesziomyces antarcticus]